MRAHIEKHWSREIPAAGDGVRAGKTLRSARGAARLERAAAVAALGLALTVIAARGQSPSPAPPSPPPSPPQEHAVNPHWKADACNVCHSAEGPPARIEPRDVAPLCLSCHDGQKAVSEAHPVGRGPSAQARVPSDWPLVNGRLSCITCHDMSRHCSPSPRRPEYNTQFLRELPTSSTSLTSLAQMPSAGTTAAGAPAVTGATGTNAARSTLCAVCHMPESHARLNPHHMLDADAAPIADRCGFCHADPAEALRRGPAGSNPLHTDEVSLCGGCHPRHIDFFTPGHIGAPARAKITQALLDLDGRMGALRADNRPAVLPLTDHGQVTCSSCHNPHQEGVFPPTDIRSLGAMRPGDTTAPIKALRLPAAQLCAACHPRVGDGSRSADGVRTRFDSPGEGDRSHTGDQARRAGP